MAIIRVLLHQIRVLLGRAFREHFVSPVDSKQLWRKKLYQLWERLKLFCLYHMKKRFREHLKVYWNLQICPGGEL